MYIYLAGLIEKPDPITNLRRAINVAERMETRGHRVFVPHLNLIWDLIYPHDKEFWMDRDFAWIKRCDILVRMYGISEGADREVALAKGLQKLVFGDVNLDGVQEFMNSKYWCETETK